MRFSIGIDYVKYGVQIELGSASTDYEHYACSEITVDDSTAEVKALNGINNIFAYDAITDNPSDYGIYNFAREVTVTGKANPAAIIDKLTKAVLSLGGNI